MALPGFIEERLPCGGILRAGVQSWEIRYTFPGRDRRFKCTHIIIHGSEINKYIAALQENWEEMERLKSKLPDGTRYTANGTMGMMIQLGYGMDGIFLQPYKKAIRSKKSLETFISSLEHAKQRAIEIRSTLSKF